MPELLSKITRPIIESTPLFAQQRVADALLRLPELRLAVDKASDDGTTRTHANWYERNRDTTLSRHSAMGMNERIWFLLEASTDDREQWVTLITRNDGDYDLEDIAQTFQFQRLQSDHRKDLPLSPQESRERFFQEFLTQYRSTDPNIKSSFQQKLATLARSRSRLAAEFHEKMTPH